VPRVLLVDDDKHINEVIKTALEMVGHDVRAVESAQQAATVCGSFVPDVAVVDLNLPGESGFDVLTLLAELCPHCLQVLASGMADAKLLRMALDAGAMTMLSKPYAMTDLMGLLEWASLLQKSLESEASQADTMCETLQFTCPCAEGVRVADLTKIVAVARHANTASVVACRNVLIVAGELMKNAATHGALPNRQGNYEVEMSVKEDQLALTVTSPGAPFDWTRALARAGSSLEKNRASGLQIVSTLTDDLHYVKQGRVACAHISMRPINREQ
jgi:FixJ family two-component response regulator/anti-sigma regulatory factor (Ser/Thr protein kinase)